MILFVLLTHTSNRSAALLLFATLKSSFEMLRLLRPCRIAVESHSFLTRSGLSSVAGHSTPWFVDQDFAHSRPAPPHLSPPSEFSSALQAQSLPSDLPIYLTALFAELVNSPYLEQGGVKIGPPLPTRPGPPLPSALPKGRRRRGRTEYGLGVPDVEGGLWRWIVIAQVRVGTFLFIFCYLSTDDCFFHKQLLKAEPPVSLPPNRKRREQDGWGMLDAGDFAVHVLSRSAREKYFPVDAQVRTWQW
ncbi:hypothetical protein DFH11DRAFT_1575900 [Phellopilus nigrolimitatus]|nr:hypothetical protein DFH11DRAFT_1575900 [Phellopilus nigrolimitatus]